MQPTGQHTARMAVTDSDDFASLFSVPAANVSEAPPCPEACPAVPTGSSDSEPGNWQRQRAGKACAALDSQTAEAFLGEIAANVAPPPLKSGEHHPCLRDTRKETPSCSTTSPGPTWGQKRKRTASLRRSRLGYGGVREHAHAVQSSRPHVSPSLPLAAIPIINLATQQDKLHSAAHRSPVASECQQACVRTPEQLPVQSTCADKTEQVANGAATVAAVPPSVQSIRPSEWVERPRANSRLQADALRGCVADGKVRLSTPVQHQFPETSTPHADRHDIQKQAVRAGNSIARTAKRRSTDDVEKLLPRREFAPKRRKVTSSPAVFPSGAS
jgi:hypothetical protein